MTTIAGLAPTGRTLKGPASDLVEVEDEHGLQHTAIVFHPAYCTHPAITDALEVVKGFLEQPLVTGLVEIVGHDPEVGAFVYPTGPVWSVAEVVRSLADRGEPGGVRAGLELMYTAGQVLVEGADAGASQGVYSHGGLTPRRIMIKRDGQVLVVGYALPQVEILQFHEDQQQIPREDSFRYCPPERIEARPEDLTSDLFGLALIAFELMTGKPVYDGLVNDIRQQAARGEGSRRLFRFREVLPEGVRNLLTKALRPDPEARYLSGDEFLEEVHGELANRSIPGRSLIDLMSDVCDSGRRVGKALEQGRTMMVEKDDLKEAVAQGDDARDLGALGRSASVAKPPSRRRRAIPRREGQEVADSEPLSAAAQLPAPEEAPAPTPEPEATTPETTASAGDSPRWSRVSRPPPRRPVRTAKSSTSSSEPVAAPVSAPASASGSSAPPPPMVPPAEGEPDRFQEPPRESAPPPDMAVNTAEDLLARIRGSDSSAEPSDLTPQRDVNQTINWPMGQVEVFIDAESEDSDAATVMLTPEQLRAKVAAAMAEDEVTEEAPKEAREEVPALKSPAPEEAPALPSPVSPGEISLTISGTEGSDPFAVRVQEDLTVAELIGSVVGLQVPIPMDIGGQLAGWYRLTQDGKPVGPDARVSSLDPDSLSLESVPNETRIVEIEVAGGDGNVRFSNPVGTAIPVASIIAHLRGWLALPGSRWTLTINDKPLSAHAILADAIGPGVVKLQLKQDTGVA